MSQVTPEVTWAQRSSDSEPERNYLYVNINAPDVEKPDLKITPTNVSFTGTSSKGVQYHVSLDLYAEIDPENSKVNHSLRDTELILRKKELKVEYWPRLVKGTQKLHFLKTNFDKWVDEEDQDEQVEDDYANNFGGGDFDGMGQGGLGNIDFSKLGAGLGGLGGAGFPGGEEEDDDDMPDLEEADKAEGEENSSKIQEVA